MNKMNKNQLIANQNGWRCCKIYKNGEWNEYSKKKCSLPVRRYNGQITFGFNGEKCIFHPTDNCLMMRFVQEPRIHMGRHDF